MQKKKTFAVLMVVGLFVLLTTPLCAQSTRITADIPFEFVVAGKTLPAGEYEVYGVSDSRSILRITSLITGHRESVVFMSASRSFETNDQETKLTFNRYGTHYFLSRIWVGHGTGGWSVGKGRVQRELAKRSPAGEAETLTVLAKR